MVKRYEIFTKLTYEEQEHLKKAVKMYKNICRQVGDEEVRILSEYLYRKICSKIKIVYY